MQLFFFLLLNTVYKKHAIYFSAEDVAFIFFLQMGKRVIFKGFTKCAFH